MPILFANALRCLILSAILSCSGGRFFITFFVCVFGRYVAKPNISFINDKKGYHSIKALKYSKSLHIYYPKGHNTKSYKKYNFYYFLYNYHFYLEQPPFRILSTR